MRLPPQAPQAVFELGVPVLGICYGMQTMAQQLGGRVAGGQRANSATPKSQIGTRRAGCSKAFAIATTTVARCSMSG